MNAKLRIWRVATISKTGMHAPLFFVETTEFKIEKAEIEALKKARAKSSLSRFDNWGFELTKCKVRKDEFGRYIKHHQ